MNGRANLRWRVRVLRARTPAAAADDGDRGYIMLVTAVLSIIMLSLLAAYLVLTDISKTTTRAFVDGNNTFVAAESGMNTRAQNVLTKFVAYARPTGTVPTQFGGGSSLTTTSTTIGGKTYIGKKPTNSEIVAMMQQCIEGAAADKGTIDFQCQGDPNAAAGSPQSRYNQTSNWQDVANSNGENRNRRTSYTAYTFVIDRTMYEDGDSAKNPLPATIPSGQIYAGLNAQTYLYTIYASAVDNQNTAGMRANSFLQMDFKSRVIPLFQRLNPPKAGFLRPKNYKTNVVGDYYAKADLRLKFYPDRSMPFDLVAMKTGGSRCGSSYDIPTNRQEAASLSCTSLTKGQLRSLQQPVLITNTAQTGTNLEILNALKVAIASAEGTPLTLANLNSSIDISTGWGLKFKTLLDSIPGLAPADITTLVGQTPNAIISARGSEFLPPPIQLVSGNTNAPDNNTNGGFCNSLYSYKVPNTSARTCTWMTMLQTNINSLTQTTAYTASDRRVPAAIMADTITVLSNQCENINKQVNCGNLDGTNTSNPQVTNGIGINAAFLSNLMKSESNQIGFADRYNGGLNKYMRLLENWGGSTSGTFYNYTGSMVSLGEPIESDKVPDGAGVPRRNFNYDPNFNSFDGLPPMTPSALYLQQEVFKRRFN